MHNNHMNPALIRARIRRTLDPCALDRATLIQGGAQVCALTIWLYRKRSLSAGIAMALSGVLSGEDAADYALVLDALPEGVELHAEDELEIGQPDETPRRYRVMSVSPWPRAGAAALLRLSLKEAAR